MIRFDNCPGQQNDVHCIVIGSLHDIVQIIWIQKLFLFLFIGSLAFYKIPDIINIHWTDLNSIIRFIAAFYNDIEVPFFQKFHVVRVKCAFISVFDNDKSTFSRILLNRKRSYSIKSSERNVFVLYDVIYWFLNTGIVLDKYDFIVQLPVV